MAPRARVDIRFHPVGHGLFSSIGIYMGERNFNLLFDCGSHIKCREALSRALDSFLAEGAKDIDVLVISHLHYDHVSGVVKLLSNANVKTVVLPYILPEERLLIAAQQMLFPLPPWYHSFLISPASFLASLGVEEIRFLRGTGEEGPPELPLTRPPEGPSEAQGSFEIIWPGAAEDIPAHEQRHAKNVKEILGVPVFFTRVNGHAFLALSRAPLPAYAFLIFFLYPIRRDILERFKRCLYSKLGIMTIEPETMRRLLLRAEGRRKLRQCYKILAKGIEGTRELNFTSLSLLLILIFYNQEEPLCFPVKIYPLRPYFPSFLLHLRTIMSLLTGDTRLDVNKIWKAFENRYGRLLRSKGRLLIFQVPHHGSLKGFNTAITGYLQPPCLSIISCSAYGLYNLPSKRVVHSLIRVTPLELCTEINSVRVLFHIF